MPTDKRSSSLARTTPSHDNLSSPHVTRSVKARQIRQSFRKSHLRRTHQQLHEAADWLRDGIDVEASAFASMWIGVGLRIAADLLEELAAEMLVEDIVSGECK